MLKAANTGHLILGLTPDELEILKNGQPIMVRLDDIGYKALVTIMVGKNNEEMKAMIESVNYRKRLQELVPKIDMSKVKGD
jgi:hypothetical protein